MSNFNPHAKISRSRGIDLDIMYVYTAGKIEGRKIKQCLEWRKKLINHYKNYEWDEEIQDYASFPIAFLDALNSKEGDSVDEKGLSSFLPAGLIYDKDLLSVKKADVIVANMDDFMEEGLDFISDKVKQNMHGKENVNISKEEMYEHILKLEKTILERRPNWGTDSEVAWSLYLNKPTILIAPTDRLKYMLERHPFTKRASVIVSSVEELIEKKWLEIIYKAQVGAIY